MADESEANLKSLNEDIPNKENDGDRLFFESRLAPVFAFRRADGVLDNREMFLLSLKREENKDKKRAVDPDTVQLVRLGNSRVLVNSEVIVGNKRYHNSRLFLKSAVGDWQILAWANEAI